MMIWLTPWLALFGIFCQAGAMPGEGSDAVCQMSLLGYIWFKAVWAGMTAGNQHPQYTSLLVW